MRTYTMNTSMVVRKMILPLMVLVLAGCQAPPQTVPFVDLGRYVGLWYQVGGYPFRPSQGLVGITADYSTQTDGSIKVVNKGFVGDFNGPVDTIEGVATVVDTSTNAKLAVSFPAVFFGLLKGEYWVIRLDEINYDYAVVSDSSRTTLFILSRSAVMDTLLYNEIVDSLVADGFDRRRIIPFAQQ